MSTVTVEGEVTTDVLTTVPAPIGLGFRVPLLIVSPWTRGDIVVSEAYDHTSVIQFLEVRFNITCPNISPWRRAMTGNLLAAFDFEHPNYDWPGASLPDTSGYVEAGDVDCRTLPPPVVPEVQSMPAQEPGTRTSRALPYEFQVHDDLQLVSDTAGGTAAVITFAVQNTGEAGAPFVLYDVQNLATVNPRQYAVEAAKSIADRVTIPDVDSASKTATRAISSDIAAAASSPQVPYHYALMGINGFVREFRGSVDTTGASQCNAADARLGYQKAEDSVMLTFANHAASGDDLIFALADNAYNTLGGKAQTIFVSAGQTKQVSVNTALSGNWYDFSVTMLDCYSRRFMGRMETGKDTISDPAMGAGIAGLWQSAAEGAHPLVPHHLRQIKRLEGKYAPIDKDAQFHAQLVDPVA